MSVDSWRENVSSFLAIHPTTVSLDDIDSQVPRPFGVNPDIKILDVLQSDPFQRFAISGEGKSIRARRLFKVDDIEIKDTVELWRTMLAEYLASQSITVGLSDIGSQVSRPPGLPTSVKLIDVLRSDSQNRFVITGEGNNIRTKFNFHLDETQISRLVEQWRENISRFLSTQSTTVGLSDIGSHVVRPFCLPNSVKLLETMQSDPLGRFAISGEGSSIRARRVFRVDDGEIVEFVEEWRCAIAQYLHSQHITVSLSDIGSNVSRPHRLPTSVKLVEVMRSDPHNRFVLSGDGNNIRAALSSSTRSKFFTNRSNSSSLGMETQHIGGLRASRVMPIDGMGAAHWLDPVDNMTSHADFTVSGSPLSSAALYPMLSPLTISKPASVAKASQFVYPNRNISGANGRQHERSYSPPSNDFHHVMDPGFQTTSTLQHQRSQWKVVHNNDVLSQRHQLPHGRYGEEGVTFASQHHLAPMPSGNGSRMTSSALGAWSPLDPFRSASNTPVHPQSRGTLNPGNGLGSGWSYNNSQSDFICPITAQVMDDPVICADGFTYSRRAIEDWLRVSDTSPQTGAQLLHMRLVPNTQLRTSIEDFKRKNRDTWLCTPSPAPLASLPHWGSGERKGSDDLWAGVVGLGPVSVSEAKGEGVHDDDTDDSLLSLCDLLKGSVAVRRSSKTSTASQSSQHSQVSFESAATTLESLNDFPGGGVGLFDGMEKGSGHMLGSRDSISEELFSAFQDSAHGVTDLTTQSPAETERFVKLDCDALGSNCFSFLSSQKDFIRGDIQSRGQPGVASDNKPIGLPPAKPIAATASSSVLQGSINEPLADWLPRLFSDFDGGLVKSFVARLREEGFVVVRDLIEAQAMAQLTPELLRDVAGFGLGHYNRLSQGLERLTA